MRDERCSSPSAAAPRVLPCVGFARSCRVKEQWVHATAF